MIPISIQHLSVSYNGKNVVHDLSLDVADGSWIALIGPNGAGKTTVLRAIAGLVDFDGAIGLGPHAVAAMARKKLAQLVAYVPQRPFIPRAQTVTDYILMGRNPYIRYFAMESRSDLDVVAEVLERLELVDFATRPLGSLSGGEVQRVVLGRALAQRAPVLLLDEPTSALDVGHQQQVLELVDSLRAEAQLTVISTMHDLTLAGQYTESLVLLDGGRAVAHGTPNEVLQEEVISRHYGARVRVIRSDTGEVLVVPARAKANEKRASSE